MILLFSMETFKSLMDQVDELFMMTQSDPQTLSQLYLDQIRENPYSRWFAYDVVRNHLRYYREYRKFNISLLDNSRGARWAFYPAVMVMIDQLIADEYIKVVSYTEYKDDPIYINSESIGIVVRYDQIDYLNSMEGDDDGKLEYLDLRVGNASTIDVPRVRIRLTNQLYPLLSHIHLQFKGEVNVEVILSGPTIKYLSVHSGLLPVNSHNIIELLVNDNVQLDYLNAYWYSKMMLDIHRQGQYIEELLNRHMRYIDIRTTGTTMREIICDLFRDQSPRVVEQNPEDWPRLTHLGFRYLSAAYESFQINTDRSYTLAAIKNYIKFLPQLTSLDIPLLNSHASIVNQLADQLVCLGLNYVSRDTNNIVLPTRLKHIRTLDLSLPTPEPNMKIGRWNLPKTCSLLSMYCVHDVIEFTNFDLRKFKHIKYMIGNYSDSVEDSWLSSASSRDMITSIVDYPASRSAILSPPDYSVVWQSTIWSLCLSLEELIELFKEVQPQNNHNTNVFLKKLILEESREILRES